jgi:hypothetical protein
MRHVAQILGGKMGVRGRRRGGGSWPMCTLKVILPFESIFILQVGDCAQWYSPKGSPPPFLGAKIKSKIDIFHLAPTKLTSVSTMASALYY